MPNYLAAFTGGLIAKEQDKHIASELIKTNEYTGKFGIVLSKADCMAIAECRSEALRENERIEVGVGAAKRIVEEFCDSGYVSQLTFADIVQGLLDCFYTIKAETEDRVSDDAVLEFLHGVFETDAGGDPAMIYGSQAYADFIAASKQEKNKKYE